MKSYERHLTERDRELLAHVEHFRVSTEGLARKAVFGPKDSSRNVARVFRRLVRRGLLRPEGLSEHEEYYTIRCRGLAILGLPPRTPRPLTEQTLPTLLAVTSYCVNRSMTRFKGDEFEQRYPELVRQGMRNTSYVIVPTDHGPVLEMLLVDRGGAPRRLPTRIRRMIGQRSSLPAFAALMNAGRFRFNVLTGTLVQAAKIERAMAKHSLGPVAVVQTAIPELADLLLLRR